MISCSCDPCVAAHVIPVQVDTLRALLSEKDAEYAEMCQQFEVNLRSKNQQIKSLESHINKMSSQLNLMQTEIATKTDQINALQLTVSITTSIVAVL